MILQRHALKLLLIIIFLPRHRITLKHLLIFVLPPHKYVWKWKYTAFKIKQNSLKSINNPLTFINFCNTKCTNFLIIKHAVVYKYFGHIWVKHITTLVNEYSSHFLFFTERYGKDYHAYPDDKDNLRANFWHDRPRFSTTFIINI